MVAFAGQKYAARSLPILVADSTNTITSFTLVNSISMVLYSMQLIRIKIIGQLNH